MVDLDAFDKHARRQLAAAKRAKKIVVRGQRVYFRVTLRGAIDHETQDLLRTVTNIHSHGKAYAPDEPTKELVDLHSSIPRGLGFSIPLVLDLQTGTIAMADPLTGAVNDALDAVGEDSEVAKFVHEAARRTLKRDP